MQFLRTVILIIITAALVAFVAMNWETVTLRLWPQSDGEYFTFDAPGGLIAIIFFFIGLIPAWLYYRGVRWRMRRKISVLKQDIRALEEEKRSAIAEASMRSESAEDAQNTDSALSANVDDGAAQERPEA